MSTAVELRQARAEVLVSRATSAWIPCTTRDGGTAFGIPSQTHTGVYHIATADSCTCKDATYRSGPCKHVRAVRLAVVQFGLTQPEEGFAF